MYKKPPPLHHAKSKFTRFASDEAQASPAKFEYTVKFDDLQHRLDRLNRMIDVTQGRQLQQVLSGLNLLHVLLRKTLSSEYFDWEQVREAYCGI